MSSFGAVPGSTASQQRHRLPAIFTALLCTFLVLFPKGGFRIGTIPQTWGYLLLALSFPLLIPVRLFLHRAVVLRRQLLALLLLVPFWLLFAFAWLRNGVEPGSFGGVLSTVVGMYALPVAFLWIYPAFLPGLNGDLLAKWLRRAILLAALWGIFQFFWRPITGFFIEVPYLTINGAESADLASYKMIARGAFFKLVSTYNNGNIYGACTLTVLPVFDLLARRRWHRLAVRAALFLTLSRTVWAGLVFEQLLTLAGVIADQARSFPVVRLRRARGPLLLLAVFVPIFVLLVALIGYNAQGFLLDESLGGRSSQLAAVHDPTVLPSLPVNWFTEIVYLSALNMLGITGFLATLLVFGGPLLVLAADTRAWRDPFRRAALKGLLLYALIAWSDGGINLIPVLAFYWFVYMIFLFGFPRGRQLSVAAVPLQAVHA